MSCSDTILVYTFFFIQFFYPSFVTEDIKPQNNGHPKLILLFTCFFIYQSLRWCSSHTCLWLRIAIFSRASNTHTTANILVQQALSNCLAFLHLIFAQYQYIYFDVWILGMWENGNPKPKAFVGWAPSKRLVDKKAGEQTAHKPVYQIRQQGHRAYCLISILWHTLYTTLKLAHWN